MKKVLLIVNPTAGKMKSKGAMFEIVSRLCADGWRVTVQTTLYRGHAAELAAVAGEEHDLCICCGGDGTLNEMISGMMDSEHPIPVGYIPCGTTNDFATSMSIPTTIPEATDNIIKNEPIAIDIGSFQGRYFTYIASFGAFTATSYNTPQEKKNVLGHLAYVLEGIKDLSSIRPYKMSCLIDGETVEDEYIFGSVSNSTSVAGIVKLSPDLVDMRDGLFEVLLVKCPKNPAELSRVIHGATTSDFSSDMFRFFKTPEITFTMDEAIPWTLDGEYAEGSTSVTAKVHHEAISIRK